MATKIWSLLGYTGWRSQGRAGYDVSAVLDGHPIHYTGDDIKVVERLFYRACWRMFWRRWLPWLALPPELLGVQTGPDECTQSVLPRPQVIADTSINTKLHRK